MEMKIPSGAETTQLLKGEICYVDTDLFCYQQDMSYSLMLCSPFGSVFP